MTSIIYSCMKKVSLFFPYLICKIRIRDKRQSDPGYQKMVGSGIKDSRIRDTKKWSDPG
jgi:hypothetical protein